METLENGTILQATIDRLMDSPSDITFLAIGFIGFLVCISKTKSTLLKWIYFVVGLFSGLAHYDALTDSSIFTWLLQIVNFDPKYFQNADIVVRIIFGFATGVICHFVAQAVLTQTIVGALINLFIMSFIPTNRITRQVNWAVTIVISVFMGEYIHKFMEPFYGAALFAISWEHFVRDPSLSFCFGMNPTACFDFDNQDFVYPFIIMSVIAVCIRIVSFITSDSVSIFRRLADIIVTFAYCIILFAITISVCEYAGPYINEYIPMNIIDYGHLHPSLTPTRMTAVIVCFLCFLTWGISKTFQDTNAHIDIETDDPVQLELSNILVNENRWPLGLAQSLTRSLKRNVYHSFIIDDSGSMSSFDGNRVEHLAIGTSVSVATTRWDELKTNVKLFAEIAHVAHAPCEFRFLNRTDKPIVIGNQDNGQDNMESESNKTRLFDLLAEGPSGTTPLCGHIREVVTTFQKMEAELRSRNKSVSMTIFTDGIATDGNIEDVLRPLEDFPARTVVRLCTDDTDTVDYWNGIDSRLENFNLDVLDNYFAECEEVMRFNPWLNYAEPIHCIREFGVHYAELDLIDERRLSPEEIKRLLAIILGGRSDDYPHPADTETFIQYMQERLRANPNLFNPHLRRTTPLICVDEF